MQLAAPMMLAIYFAFRRQPQGVTFCLFFYFEQLPIATYMADARAQELPLLTVGNGAYVIHDWNYLFGRLGLLAHDTQIASAMRVIGWLGMLATVAWFVWRGLTPRIERHIEPAASFHSPVTVLPSQYAMPVKTIIEPFPH